MHAPSRTRPAYLVASVVLLFAATVPVRAQSQSSPNNNLEQRVRDLEAEVRRLREARDNGRTIVPMRSVDDTDPPPVVPSIPKYPGLHQDGAPRWAALMAKARAGDSDLVVPAAERSRYQASFARFASRRSSFRRRPASFCHVAMTFA